MTVTLIFLAGTVIFFLYHFWAEINILNVFEIKYRYTVFSVILEKYLIWITLIWLPVMVGLIFIGIPSGPIIFWGILLWGPVIAFVFHVLANLFSTRYILRKFSAAAKESPMLEPEMINLLKNSELSGFELALWPRLFLALPPRTLDLFIATVRIETEREPELLYRTLLGTSLRCGMQATWIYAVINVLTDFRPFPERDMAAFLFASGALLFSAILVRIPEFVPGKRAMRKFCLGWIGETVLPAKSPESLSEFSKTSEQNIP
ncbi:hypothetical protein HYY75_09840 [bacterium]|nr:hypothetical protein [bacterium]